MGRFCAEIDAIWRRAAKLDRKNQTSLAKRLNIVSTELTSNRTMQDKQHPPYGFVHAVLPWIVSGIALLVYVLTLNPWVTLDSLPYVAKVTGWDWVLPLHAPLFFLLTYPIRWLPDGLQPIALNLFAAVCSALAMGLLARSVGLLPHDRTHAQRQRERNEYSLLSASFAWMPPVFAALLCGMQLTVWEHSVAATNEALSLLVFAYAIRCLLEYRIDPQESWLIRLALVYGLGVANNWAMIGFFPCFLIALIWIRGTSFFQIGFIVRMIAIGAVGLSLYLLLPLAWTMVDASAIDFWQALKAQWVNQKAYLLRPELRSRALVLSLTSILPVLIMGVRWPSSFGDTSAAGAVISNLMFRLIHVLLLGACLWTFFDQKFSPRSLITTKFLSAPSLLTFYYLTALSIGYLSGYVLLVFGEGKDRPWKRRGHGESWLERVLVAAVWVALVAAPAGLVYKNFKTLWNNSSRYLKQFAALCGSQLPPKNSIVLSDDLNSLLLLEAHLRANGASDKHVLVHSRSLPIPEYHRQLAKRYPTRWPDVLNGEPQGTLVDDVSLLSTMLALGRTNAICYLHPSFGYYFEWFYSRPQGLVHHLMNYPTNVDTPPPLLAAEFETNRLFWSNLEGTLHNLKELSDRDSRDAHFLAMFYSRAANDFGVAAQRMPRLEEAERFFALASGVNTNNKAARVNLEFNRLMRSSGGNAATASKTAEDKLGEFRDWESLLAYNGPLDEPEYCFQLGELFLQQNLFRQASIQFGRVQALQPTNVLASLRQANVDLQWKKPDRALDRIAQLRASKAFAPLSPENDLALSRLEASAHFSRTNYATAQQILTQAVEKYPEDVSALEALSRFYAHSKQFTNALATIDRLLKKDPGYAPALIDQATIHFNNRAYEQSLAALERVLQKDSKNIQALLYKVLVYIESKDLKQAMSVVDRVLDADPDNYDGLLQKGILLIETKAYDESVMPLTRLLKVHPNDVNGLKNRAIANLHRKRLDESESDYEKLRRQMPKYHVPYFGLAEIAYQRKANASAIRNYEQYLKFFPNVESADLDEEKKLVNKRLEELRASGR